jgi:hypothetical protein
MDPVRQIADAVLYEGYLLWPYRRSALKNQKPFGWGDLDPGEKPLMRAQCLLEGGDPAFVEVTARFLQMVGDEGVEREVGPGPIAFPPLAGELTVAAETLGPGLHRLTVELVCRAGSFRAAHAMLRTAHGGFVSLTDPPERLRAAAEACDNVGVWPILVGEPGSADTVLCSPIILEDHPRIAPESPGDLYDGGEIDGLLTLSIMSLTDEEKAEIRAGDPRARAILERTESLSRDELMRLHGFRVQGKSAGADSLASSLREHRGDAAL